MRLLVPKSSCLWKELLIASNPVAAARFFHFMISVFIKHVLGVGADYDGIFGKTAAYYGTVEQQGHLTLHLHLLVWIMDALSPQEIREKIIQGVFVFEKAMVAYLEGCHKGEFMRGTMRDVQDVISEGNAHVDPTLTLPTHPLQIVSRKATELLEYQNVRNAEHGGTILNGQWMSCC